MTTPAKPAPAARPADKLSKPGARVPNPLPRISTTIPRQRHRR